MINSNEFDAVMRNGTDVNIRMISGCEFESMDLCERNCGKYYSCETIAYANDLLKDYEEYGGLLNERCEQSL